jgi:hypothetical protein
MDDPLFGHYKKVTFTLQIFFEKSGFGKQTVSFSYYVKDFMFPLKNKSLGNIAEIIYTKYCYDKIDTDNAN